MDKGSDSFVLELVGGIVDQIVRDVLHQVGLMEEIGDNHLPESK